MLTICLNFKVLAVEKVYIVDKVDGAIITNIDIKNEKNYLLALNENLVTLNDNQLLSISKNSIIKESIKKKEIIKYFKLDQSDPYLESFIKNLYLKLELNSREDLKRYLKKFNLNIAVVKKKIEIEYFWNRMIFQRYKNQVNVNEDLINKKIKDEEKQETKKMFQLSEIIFQKTKDTNLDDKVKKILESISEIGFKNTASLYSISDSAKLGGDIGWIDEQSLSVEILKELNKVNIGSSIGPIAIGPNFLIIKIENIKIEKKETDKKTKYEKMIEFEKNRQLEQFSKIYFNRLKINTNINEL